MGALRCMVTEDLAICFNRTCVIIPSLWSASLSDGDSYGLRQSATLHFFPFTTCDRLSILREPHSFTTSYLIESSTTVLSPSLSVSVSSHNISTFATYQEGTRRERIHLGDAAPYRSHRTCSNHRPAGDAFFVRNIPP